MPLAAGPWYTLAQNSTTGSKQPVLALLESSALHGVIEDYPLPQRFVQKAEHFLWKTGLSGFAFDVSMTTDTNVNSYETLMTVRLIETLFYNSNDHILFVLFTLLSTFQIIALF